MAKQKEKKRKNTPRDTQINASVNAQETHDQEARSPCGVNTEMENQGEKKIPGLLNVFCLFFSLLHEPKSSEAMPVLVPLRMQSSTNNWSGAAGSAETRSEPRSLPRPFGGGTAPEPGQAQIPASRKSNRSPPTRSRGVSCPPRQPPVQGREGGRESRALPPPQPMCSAHIYTHARPRSCPRPPGPPALSAPRQPVGSRGRVGGTSGNFEPCLSPSHPCGCREETYPPGEGTDFSPMEKRKRRRRRKGEAEARCRPSGCRAAESGRPPARSRRPP